MEENIKLRNMYRVQIVDMDGEVEYAVAGDSGFMNNQVTNLGYLNLVKLLGTGLTGSQISHVGVGTGGTISSSATALPGEVVKRAALTAASNGSTALQMTATFASSASFITAAANLSNIGLFPASAASTIMAGGTYASSLCNTNQNINVTYQWGFA